MARKFTFTPPGYWLLITQRGHGQIFRQDVDRRFFLRLLGELAAERRVQILSYCLMPDHFHLVAQGRYPQAIPEWVRKVTGGYAAYLNAGERVWQDRYASCAVDEERLRTALRYVERNPVRAGLVKEAAQFEWSSAAAHVSRKGADFLNQDEFSLRFGAREWRSALAAAQTSEELEQVRGAIAQGQPLGSPEFLERLETEFDVVLRKALVTTA